MSLLKTTLRKRRRTSKTHRSTSLTRTTRKHYGPWVSLTTHINHKIFLTFTSCLPLTEELERKEKEAEQKRQQKEKHEQEKRNKALREAALKALKKKRKQDTPVQSQDVQDTPEKSDEQSGSQVSLRIFIYVT